MSMPNTTQGGGKPREDWKAPSAPHGYDLCEFDPSRDAGKPRRTRPHYADEERLRLRRAQDALEAGEPVHEIGTAEDQDEVEVSGRSRLYRE